MKIKVTEYQPKTGARCSCKRGIQRDNCATCEGTGWIIDFAAIRRRNIVTVPPTIGICASCGKAGVAVDCFGVCPNCA